MIKTKQQSIELRDRLQFGNTWPFWQNITEYKNSQYSGNVVIQYRARDSPFMKYDIREEDFDRIVNDFINQGADSSLMYVSVLVPTDKIILQGECVNYNGFQLNYNTLQMHMRDSLKHSSAKHASGIVAKTILKHYMDGNSYDCLQEIFDNYDRDPLYTLALEFTVLSSPMGRLNWNTIFWEARNY